MKISTLPIEEIKPYEKNPRRNDQAVDKVANSIREFGFRQPIVVDETNTIIIGHTCTFYGSTWTMNRANVLQLLQLFDTGRFDQIAILTGFDTDEIDKLLAPTPEDADSAARVDKAAEPRQGHAPRMRQIRHLDQHRGECQLHGQSTTRAEHGHQRSGSLPVPPNMDGRHPISAQ